jgi:hypothetical protein
MKVAGRGGCEAGDDGGGHEGGLLLERSLTTTTVPDRQPDGASGLAQHFTSPCSFVLLSWQVRITLLR